MNRTKIEWTEKTWNPITGCSEKSKGCQNCYAKKMAKRLKAMGNPRYQNEFEVTIHEDLFEVPLSMKKSSVIFVCSMSDIFHEKVDFTIIKKLFDVMKRAEWHIFQVLTKRPDRLEEFSKMYDIPDNIWVGTSIELSEYGYRLDSLKKTKAKTKFVSCEPLLGSLQSLDFTGIDWIVTGGESGSGARPVKEKWLIELRNQCINKDIYFFFKQWGGWNKKKNGHILDGKEYKEMPPIEF